MMRYSFNPLRKCGYSISEKLTLAHLLLILENMNIAWRPDMLHLRANSSNNKLHTSDSNCENKLSSIKHIQSLLPLSATP